MNEQTPAVDYNEQQCFQGYTFNIYISQKQGTVFKKGVEWLRIPRRNSVNEKDFAAKMLTLSEALNGKDAAKTDDVVAELEIVIEQFKKKVETLEKELGTYKDSAKYVRDKIREKDAVIANLAQALATNK